MKALRLVNHYKDLFERARALSEKIVKRPRVYFEEWDKPTFSAIRWVSELIEIAGGEDVFSDKSYGKLASQREVQWSDVVEMNPDIILASWCGKPVDIDSIRERPGWDSITAVRNGRIHEIDPSIILQPGPASLTDGLRVLQSLLIEGA